MHKFVLDLQGTVITKSFVVIIIYEVFALYYFLGIDFFFSRRMLKGRLLGNSFLYSLAYLGFV